MLIIKTLIYHQDSRRARSSRNKAKNRLNVNGIGLIMLLIFNNLFFRRKVFDKSEIGILTSPTNHTRIAVEKLTSNTIYIGKGHITRYCRAKLSFTELKQVVQIARRRGMRIIESIAIGIELKSICELLLKCNFQKIYITNYIDRYAYMLSQLSKQHGINLVVIPHGRVMRFDLNYKYEISKLVYTCKDDLLISKDYFRFELSQYIEELNPHQFTIIDKDVIAFFSSANRARKYYWFLIRIIWDFRDKEVWVYPHPRESLAFYKLLNSLNLISLPSERVLNSFISFCRLSSVSVDLFERKCQSVVFLNFEGRDTRDFPKNSVVFKNISDYESRIN